MPGKPCQNPLRLRHGAVSPPSDITIGPDEREIAAIESTCIFIGNVEDLERHRQAAGRFGDRECIRRVRPKAQQRKSAAAQAIVK